MALTPTDNNAFLREVDDDLRRDRMVGFARNWGRAIAIVVAAGLLALAGFLLWQNHRRAEAGRDAEALSLALADLGRGKANAADPRLAALARSPRDGYRGLARLTVAEIKGRTDRAAAVADYRAIAEDAGLPQPIRDVATIRGTTLGFDALAPQAAIDRLKPLAVPGGPWFGSAGELTGMAWLKLNRADRAGPLFAAIARDPSAPATLRARAAGMASALGQTVRPSASAATLKE